jgi:hypothetical protein
MTIVCPSHRWAYDAGIHPVGDIPASTADRNGLQDTDKIVLFIKNTIL